MESKMAKIINDRMPKIEVKLAIARARNFLSNAPDKEFARSALKEFDDARFNYRDHTVDLANDLRRVLCERRADLDARADAARLVALGEIVSILSVMNCNGVLRTRIQNNGKPYTGADWSESDDAISDAIRSAVSQEMNRILAPYGAKVESLHGDPRGRTVHIAFADGASNRGLGSRVYGIG
jgi:hypothetical protein